MRGHGLDGQLEFEMFNEWFIMAFSLDQEIGYFLEETINHAHPHTSNLR